MMRGVLFLWSALVILVLSCTTEEAMESDWPLGVKYEIFVLSFADGNGDGKGDLKGLTEKLDYVQDLGVNGIWLMPIMPSPSYHKYDVTDYKAIHPDYGTWEDFRSLVAAAHRRNIRVVIDLVLNHTSREHPWFKSAASGKNSPYRDYFIWADKDSIRNEIAKKTVTLDSDNITQWHAVEGDTLTEHYYGFFSSRMPDLNFDNPKVWSEFVEIARFWLEEMKVDGFRFDAAKHLYPGDRATDCHAFWKWYRAELEKIKPDVYLIGEVYSMDAEEVAPYTVGLPSLFNFDMGSAIIHTLQAGEDTLGLMKRFQIQSELFKATSPNFLDSPILTNHDQNRICSALAGDVNKTKLAASILLTLPGAPYLYYGEELGMLGMKPDEFIREPFPWGTAKHTTTWMKPRYNVENDFPSLQKQQQDDQSIFQHYKKLLAFRNSSRILTKGDALAIEGLPLEVIGLKRLLEGKALVILHNISEGEVIINLNTELKAFNTLDFSTHPSNALKGNVLTLAPYSTVVLGQ